MTPSSGDYELWAGCTDQHPKGDSSWPLIFTQHYEAATSKRHDELYVKPVLRQHTKQ